MTNLTLVTSRSPTACMPEPAGSGTRSGDRRQGYPTSRSSPTGNFILRLKFLRENDDDRVLEDKFDQVRTERKKARGSSRSLGTQSLAC